MARCIDTVGVGFMFAQVHHKAMKYAAGPRRELGLRTLFNMLAHWTNPAGVRHQVVGVFTQELCKPLAEVLKRLGSEHVLVVHSRDGLDEFSSAAATHIAELKDGEVREYEVRPEDFVHSPPGLEVDSPQAAGTDRDAFGAAQDRGWAEGRRADQMNAGPALYAPIWRPVCTRASTGS